MATLSQAGLPGVSNGILMPRMKNRWRLTFQGISGGVGNGNDLSMQCVNAARPSLTFEEVKLHRYNSIAYIAGKHDWEAMSVTVEDDITSKAGTVIQNQLELQQKLIGASGPFFAAAATASTYKFGSKLEMLDGDQTVTESWIMEGVYIANANWNEVDYSASEAMTITLSLRFDHARQVLPPNDFGTALGGFVNS